MSSRTSGFKKRPTHLEEYPGIEGDKTHHLTGPFLPQTPLGGLTPTDPKSLSPTTVARNFSNQRAQRSVFIRWVIDPSLSLQILLIPLALWLLWAIATPVFDLANSANPFSIFLISGYIPTSSLDDPRYRKTWWDIPFIIYYIVVFSFIRESLADNVSRPLARYFRIRSEKKWDRFAEQFYALIYFFVFGAWGFRVMTQLPTFWFKTSEFWAGYPFWDMQPELKAYYLIQFAYWWQQLLVMVLGLEKPRSDYRELVAHHLVTLGLVGGSYILNHTVVGSAVYMSMDIPDSLLSASKLLNYMQWNTAKTYAFAIFFGFWIYFRHYLNIWILWSVMFESDSVIPEWTKHWSWSEGVYMPFWMKYCIFLPLLMLQGLNLFWSTLMTKVLIRGLRTSVVDDHRSDDEGDDDEAAPLMNEKLDHDN